MTGVRI